MLRELFGLSKAPKRSGVASSKPAPAVSASDTVIGVNSHLEGTLKGEDKVRVEGTFIGDISTKEAVAVGEQGKVEGNLIGQAVTVGGIVRGDITAHKVSILRTGRVWGDLSLEKLMTEEGGFIQGLVRMEESIDLEAVLAEKLGRPQADVVEEKPEKTTEAKKTKAIEKAK